MASVPRVIHSFGRLLSGGAPRTFGRWRFRYRQRLRSDYALVADALLRRIAFQAMYDVGCANGFLLRELKDAGRTVRGIDVSPFVRDFLPADLEAHVEIGDFAHAAGRFDLVCCVEVAEHVPPERSQELVRKLSELAGRFIYFTAAPPGQRGWGHINCRPYEDWLRWFGECGWIVDETATKALRQDLGALRKARWLQPNSFILVPKSAAPPVPPPRLTPSLNGAAKHH